MSLIFRLPEILEDGRKLFQTIIESSEHGEFRLEQRVGRSGSGNRLVWGDNLEYMRHLLLDENLGGKLALIYVDPPFYSKADYVAGIRLESDKMKKIPVIKQHAYHDTWENGMEEYLRMLTVRFMMMRELLADTGSLWVHLDWHVVHYAKVILDEIFGERNFVNEVIWNYKSGGTSNRHFARKHDTLLFYGKTKHYYFSPQKEKSYNRELKPYRFKGVKEFQDKVGWYTLVNRRDVWQIDMVGRTAGERTGYATQKPEQLLCRILESCTKEGDLCADFFGGSGTTAAAAAKLERNWISCDIGKLAVLSAHKRLTLAEVPYDLYRMRTLSEKENQLELEYSLQPAEQSDKMELEIRLIGFCPESIEDVPVEERYKKVIRKIIRKDSLQLVDYWCVDSNYDGEVLEADLSLTFCKENGSIPLSCRTICNRQGCVAVKAVDIFGNSAVRVISLER